MTIDLSGHQYGKAETRVVRIYRDSPRHEIRDLTVTTTLRGDFEAAYLSGDQSAVLPTDSQKNTCFAYAREKGVGAIEDYALDLARHFVTDIEPVRQARIEVAEHRWERVSVAGSPHPHAFVRSGGDTRTTAVTVAATTGATTTGATTTGATTTGAGGGTGQRAYVVSGLYDLVVLKSTGSEFAGFLTDKYTTLAQTHDRVLATSVTASWRYSGDRVSWDEAHAAIRQILLERFAVVHSLALQQTLWEMGRAVLAARDEVAEIRLTAPNKHHFLADLAPFGLDNPGEVFYAADRPYGLIQCAVQREGAEPAGPAWDAPAAFG
ncbi:MAG TPA: urate oxidase [Streptosporangiaceae bacterium]|jgi:urate oxidase